jgi:uncharacterized protein YecT (DUF1311 family)
MRPLLLAILIAMPVKTMARAQVPNPIDCNSAATTVEMDYCADRAYQKADEALNEAYRQALESVKSSEFDAPYDAKSWEKELRGAQRAWIAFRDADRKGLMPMEWTGGTGTTVAVLTCMIEMTQARTKALRERYGAR